MAEASERLLTPRQAYLCMHEFLRQHYERVPTDVISGLLGSLALLQDGMPVDQAYAGDWAAAVGAVMTAEAAGGYTEVAFRLE